MRLAHRIAGAVLLALALFLGAVAFRLSYYSSLGPGPGFFPLWLCGLLAILALAMIAQATLGGDGPLPVDFFPDRAGALRIAVAIFALFATAATMSLVGFRIGAFVFYVVLLVAFGRRNPLEILALAAIGSFGVYALFSRVLSQPLPTGLFDW